MEKLEMDLFNGMFRRSTELPYHSKVLIYWNILKAVSYMETSHAHCDMKLENSMLELIDDNEATTRKNRGKYPFIMWNDDRE